MKEAIYISVGLCGFCQRHNLTYDYTKIVFDENRIRIPFKCEDCGATGEEFFKIDYLSSKSKIDLNNWALSEYNEDTEDQLDYYINERQCNIGDIAYLYSHEHNTLEAMEIVKIIQRTDDAEKYDNLIKDEDVLLNGEEEYNASTSAEFITDNDCYLVWFNYIG